MSRVRIAPAVFAAFLVTVMLLGLGSPASAGGPTQSGRVMRTKGLPMSGAVEVGRSSRRLPDTDPTDSASAGAVDRRAAFLAAKTEGARDYASAAAIVPPGGPLRDVLATGLDWSFRPHNETSIAINPTNPLNIVVGMNDYHAGAAYNGYATSFDGGLSWSMGIPPMATMPITRTGRIANNGRIADGGGDPAVAFARDGTVYMAQLFYTNEDFTDTGELAGHSEDPDRAESELALNGRNGILVHRSTNGGRTWWRPTISTAPGRVSSRGIVVYEYDPATPYFHDKEWLTVDNTTGPHSGRVYVTWTRFKVTEVNGDYQVESPIMFSYSDDKAATWSTPKEISGAAAVCDTATAGQPTDKRCDQDQGSNIVVGPDGTLYVAFINQQETDTNSQLLFVRSRDGGATWEGPWRISDVYDGLGWYQRQNGVDCPFGQWGRDTLPNSCVRVWAVGSLGVDPVTGDLYYTWSDNRNGVKGVPRPDWNDERYEDESRFLSEPVMDVDVFIARSTDKGMTWTAPVRVNQDALRNRKQQWFPWVDVSENGTIAVAYYDRRDDSNDKLYHRYLSVAQRGSLAFTDTRLTSQATNPDYTHGCACFMGDYDQVVVRGGYLYGSWTDGRFASNATPFADVFIATRFALVGSGAPGSR